MLETKDRIEKETGINFHGNIVARRGKMNPHAARSRGFVKD